MQDKIAAAQLMKLVADDDDDVAARSFLARDEPPSRRWTAGLSIPRS
jgi:hypothetical protein